jgi:hypothetical protein
METPLRSSGNAFRRELAHRSADGLDVTLLWCPASGQTDESIVVCVCDSRDGVYFEIAAEPHLALNVYNHPFAYRDLSTVYYWNSRFAAA